MERPEWTDEDQRLLDGLLARRAKLRNWEGARQMRLLASDLLKSATGRFTAINTSWRDWQGLPDEARQERAEDAARRLREIADAVEAGRHVRFNIDVEWLRDMVAARHMAFGSLPEPHGREVSVPEFEA